MWNPCYCGGTWEYSTPEPKLKREPFESPRGRCVEGFHQNVEFCLNLKTGCWHLAPGGLDRQTPCASTCSVCTSTSIMNSGFRIALTANGSNFLPGVAPDTVTKISLLTVVDSMPCSEWLASPCMECAPRQVAGRVEYKVGNHADRVVLFVQLPIASGIADETLHDVIGAA